MLTDFGVQIYHGEPRFRDAHTVTTPEGDIKAAHILLAMGSRPAVPEIPGLAEAGYLTNTTLFDLTAVPESVGVIGGGYIACEMGQSLARLGANVAIFERGERLLKRDDLEVVQVLTDALQADGVSIHAGAKIARIERDGDKRVIVLTDGSRHAFAELLVTTGRKPNTDTLDLHDISVDLGGDGAVLTDEYGKTSASHIYAWRRRDGGEPVFAYGGSGGESRGAKYPASRQKQNAARFSPLRHLHIAGNRARRLNGRRGAGKITATVLPFCVTTSGRTTALSPKTRPPGW